MKTLPTQPDGNRRGGKRRRGTILVLVLVLLAVFTIMVVAIMHSTNYQVRAVWRTRSYEESLRAAQTVIQSIVNNSTYLVNNRPPVLDGTFKGFNDRIHELLPEPPKGFQYATDTGESDGKPLAYIRDLKSNSFEWSIVDDTEDEWYGYQTVRLDYELLAMTQSDVEDSARYAGFEGVALKKRLTIDYVPLYQFAIFYNDGDLELHPGPVMNVRGRVHTNADLRLSCIDKLYFHERVSSAGHFYKGGGSEEGENQKGNVYFRYDDNTTHFKSFKTADGKFVDSTWNDWATRAIDMWDENLKDQAHKVGRITPPIPDGKEAAEMIQRRSADDSDALKDVKFEYQADIIIAGDPGDPSTITAHDPAGNEIPITYKDAANNTQTYISVGEFYDGQQKTVVKTIDIDMARLREFLELNPTVNFENGMIYASTTPLPGDSWSVPTDWSSTGRDNYMAGVRVENAAQLPQGSGGGFSFATDRPLYTTGNVNTIDQATALFAGDAVTVCSQNLTLKYQTGTDKRGRPIYSSGNTSEEVSVTMPTAKETITNTIFMMGNVPTVFETEPSPDNPTPDVDGKSGGAHNVMRYLENWSGQKHNFNGSIIVMFASKLAKEKWSTAYYSPPTREYNWDTALKTAIPPPGMPFFFTVTEGPWEKVSKEYAIANCPD